MDKRKIHKHTQRDFQIAVHVLNGGKCTPMAETHRISKQRVARIVREECERADRALYVSLSAEREPRLADLRLHGTHFIQAMVRRDPFRPFQICRKLF